MRHSRRLSKYHASVSNANRCQLLGDVCGPFQVFRLHCPRQQFCRWYNLCTLDRAISVGHVLTAVFPLWKQGYAGKCLNGSCQPGSFLDAAKSWYARNLNIAIPVTVRVFVVTIRNPV